MATGSMTGKGVPAVLVIAALMVFAVPGAFAQDEETAVESEDRTFSGALDKKPGLEVDGRIGAIWKADDEVGEPDNEFSVSTARVQLSWSKWKMVEASMSAEASDLFKGQGVFSVLRDAYVRVQPLSWLGLRMGQFKKPFSRVENTSFGKLPTISRGLGNDYVIEHLGYGDRDIGVMLEGRLLEAAKLDYAIGVFNGQGKNAKEISVDGSKDLVARLEISPAKWFSFGADVSLKFMSSRDVLRYMDDEDFEAVLEDEYPDGYTEEDFVVEHEWMDSKAWMTGADLKLKLQKLKVVAEGHLGENWWFYKYPYVWTGLLMISYKARLGNHPVWLEPVVRGEVITLLVDMSDWRSRMRQLAGGLNLHLGKHIRLMVNGEFLFAAGTEADVDGSRRSGLWPNEWPGEFSNSKRLMVQLIFDI